MCDDDISLSFIAEVTDAVKRIGDLEFVSSEN
ncbi:hypothetical protein Phpb_04007 [Photorhabdus namnaonensis]|uniref:Uncharacterized protein n=1 Tax=Photorhabdus namnaonensis TaxID=1851568 RepID=A0A1B8YD00_9GAMM|nr:hypothetical protein Phpb_04007 [Photorhabdus namnaonensis]